MQWLIVLCNFFTVCIFDWQTYWDIFNEAPPGDDIIGWIETDNIPGFSENDDPVEVGDIIESGVIVYSLCYNW